MSNLVVAKKGFMNLDTLEEAKKAADLMVQSGLVPDSILKTKNPTASVILVLQAGAELGLTPMNSLQGIAIINGKPMVWGDTLLALCKASPDFEYCKESWIEDTKTAWCISKRKGQPEVETSFSMEDAKKANLLNKPGPWGAYPKRMCQFRARNFSLRDNFADVLKGMRVVEDYIGHDDKGLEINPIEHSVRHIDEVVKEAPNTMESLKNKLTPHKINPIYSHPRIIGSLDTVEPDERPVDIATQNEGEVLVVNKDGEILSVPPETASNRQEAQGVYAELKFIPIERLKSLITLLEVPQQTIYRWLMRAQVEKLEDLTDEQINATIKMLEGKNKGEE